MYHVGEFRTALTSEHRTLCVLDTDSQSEPNNVALSQLSPNVAECSLLSGCRERGSLEDNEHVMKEEDDDDSSEPEEIVCRPYIMSPEALSTSTFK